MKLHPGLFLSAAFALSLPLVSNAVTLTQAQITQIVKDVKTVESNSSRKAVMRETIQGDQALRTGSESRAELLFNDHTITRLGANSHFSFSEGTRDISLQSGVMLLQVPKGIGGAKIETAAVTAGITGTTIMLDAGRTITKLIVLEGECYILVKVAKMKDGKPPRRIWVRAGQELIIRNGTGDAPVLVYVNLKVIEATSLLLTGKWGTNLDDRLIIRAANNQNPNDYAPANAGDVSTTIGKIPQAPTTQVVNKPVINNPQPPSQPVTPPIR